MAKPSKLLKTINRKTEITTENTTERETGIPKPTDHTLPITWHRALEKLKEDLLPGEAEARLAGTMLLQVTDTSAQIAVPSRTALVWLERRMYGQIYNVMKGILGKDLDLQFVAVT
jgi:hypothetical protein